MSCPFQILNFIQENYTKYESWLEGKSKKSPYKIANPLQAKFLSDLAEYAENVADRANL